MADNHNRGTVKIVLTAVLWIGIGTYYYLKLKNATEYLSSTPAKELHSPVNSLDPEAIKTFWEHHHTWEICAQVGIYGFGVASFLVGLLCARSESGAAFSILLEVACVIGKVAVFSILINTKANHTDILGLKTAALVYICFLGIEVAGLAIVAVIFLCVCGVGTCAAICGLCFGGSRGVTSANTAGSIAPENMALKGNKPGIV